MSNLSCPHQEARMTGAVCSHVLENRDSDYVKFFTGINLHYHLVCHSCAEHMEEGNMSLNTICEACFREIEETGYWDGLAGKPEAIYKPSNLAFTHRQIQLANLLSNNLIDIQPFQHLPSSLWIGLTTDGTLLRIDFENQVVSTITSVSPSVFDLKKPISLQISPNGSHAVLTHILGVDGIVLNLETGKITMQLKRDGYHSDVTPFSAAFFIHNSKSLLIHSTSWNRLDISDPITGELLTERGPTSYKRGEQRPEHYLDYFHGRLLVSPNQEWIADDGWIWHPIGCIDSWNIRRWLEENKWESEDGLSKKSLVCRDYFWGGPFCWISKHVLAIWGYGKDDEWLIPAVCIFDVTSAKLLRWFTGTEVAPKDGKSWHDKQASYGGALIFDKYLFACSEKYGISVWDVEDGSCLHQDSSFAPINYHLGSKEFLSLLPNGNFRITQLIQKAG